MLLIVDFSIFAIVEVIVGFRNFFIGVHLIRTFTTMGSVYFSPPNTIMSMAADERFLNVMVSPSGSNAMNSPA